mgnify:CR=1 FL=1
MLKAKKAIEMLDDVEEMETLADALHLAYKKTQQTDEALAKQMKQRVKNSDVIDAVSTDI